MEQLWVRKSVTTVGEVTGHRQTESRFVLASPAEVLAAAATLNGAAVREVWHPGFAGGRGVVKPGLPDGRYLVIPLPGKETTDE